MEYTQIQNNTKYMCRGMCWYYDWWLQVWFLTILTSTCLPTVIGSNHPFGGISNLLLRIKTIKQSRPESYCEIWTMAETQYTLQCIHKYLDNVTDKIFSKFCTQNDRSWTRGLVYGMTRWHAGINGSHSLEMLKNAKKISPTLKFYIISWQNF